MYSNFGVMPYKNNLTKLNFKESDSSRLLFLGGGGLKILEISQGRKELLSESKYMAKVLEWEGTIISVDQLSPNAGKSSR